MLRLSHTWGELLRAVKGKDEQPPPPTKLEAFLSTLVLYPAFYVLATAPPSSGKHPRRWCQEPMSLHPLTIFGARLQDYLEGLHAWQFKQVTDSGRTYMQAGAQQLLGVTNKALAYMLPTPPPELSLTDLVLLKQQELNKEIEPPTLPSSRDTNKASAMDRSELPLVELSASMQQVPSERQAAKQAAVKDANPIAEVGLGAPSSVIAKPPAQLLLTPACCLCVIWYFLKLPFSSDLVGLVKGPDKKA
ncbi:hypothetical protein DUNSADRAFT_5262 [Dunaliella salina]|uniref:Encoded protein n=1 Tax=Dunaliella salina TaxID=3046 RepID=A0ABQ7FUF6_DUNSA|nr:hypothetical protein DUNSADRAFT_5262 [Dunaliella salina]|eukprot:KAF5826042.1 hypothetical protein DUNSADRAFT_5262 [Dunaliella salina]